MSSALPEEWLSMRKEFKSELNLHTYIEAMLPDSSGRKISRSSSNLLIITESRSYQGKGLVTVLKAFNDDHTIYIDEEFFLRYEDTISRICKRAKENHKEVVDVFIYDPIPEGAGESYENR